MNIKQLTPLMNEQDMEKLQGKKCFHCSDKGDSLSLASDVEYGKANQRGNIANLLKAYHADLDKYSGATCDNFDRKFYNVFGDGRPSRYSRGGKTPKFLHYATYTCTSVPFRLPETKGLVTQRSSKLDAITFPDAWENASF